MLFLQPILADDSKLSVSDILAPPTLGTPHGSLKSYSVVGQFTQPGYQATAVAISKEDFWRTSLDSIVQTRFRVEIGYADNDQRFHRKGSLTADETQKLIIGINALLGTGEPAAGFDAAEATYTCEGQFTLARVGQTWILSDWAGGSLKNMEALRELLSKALVKLQAIKQ